MFEFCASKSSLTIKNREPVVSGSVNVYQARFSFSADWDGLTRMAVFLSGGETVSILLNETDTCLIPWEVLVKPGVRLKVGVYGTRGEDVVLPTVWADCGFILEGAAPGKDTQPPSPELWRQELDRKGDTLEYDGLNLRLISGENELSTVQIAGGGGEGGTTDHRLLSGRDANNQHPIKAIEGLQEILDSIPQPMTAGELREILTNGGI